MKITEIKQVMDEKTPIEFLSRGGWLEPGWYEMEIAAIDEHEDFPRVWLKYAISGGVEVVGKKDIEERLRVKS